MAKYVIGSVATNSALDAVTASLKMQGTTLPEWSVKNGYTPARIRDVLSGRQRSEDAVELRDWVLEKTLVITVE